MSQLVKKYQFGVWIDTENATIVGKHEQEDENFEVLAKLSSPYIYSASNENTLNNEEKRARHKFYKEILSHMQNAKELIVTGPGIAQEQFVNYLKEVPQFKNTKTQLATSNKLSDNELLEIITNDFS